MLLKRLIIGAFILLAISANAQFRFKPGGNFYLPIPENRFGVEWSLKFERKIDIDKSIEFGLRKQGLFIYSSEQLEHDVYDHYLTNETNIIGTPSIDYATLEIDQANYQIELKNLSYYLGFRQYLNARFSFTFGLNLNRIRRLGVKGSQGFGIMEFEDDLDLSLVRKTFASYEITFNRSKWRRVEAHYGFRYTPLRNLFRNEPNEVGVTRSNSSIANNTSFTYGLNIYLFQIKK